MARRSDGQEVNIELVTHIVDCPKTPRVHDPVLVAPLHRVQGGRDALLPGGVAGTLGEAAWLERVRIACHLLASVVNRQRHEGEVVVAPLYLNDLLLDDPTVHWSWLQKQTKDDNQEGREVSCPSK